MAKVVLFDVDGVLVDSLDSHLKICEYLSKEYQLGLKIPTSREFRFLARSGKRISPMKEFFEAVGFPSNRSNEADRYYQEHFARDFPSQLFHGVPELLKRLHDNGVRLGIVTSNVRANVKSALGPSWRLFEPRLCFTFDDARRLSKAQALEKIAVDVGTNPDQLLFVGDQTADYQAAQQAGTDFLGVTWGWAISEGDSGFHTVESLEALGDYVMKSKPKDSMDVGELLKVVLEHGRSMFIYHAGQRHGSLNFYFAVLGVFVAGFVSLFTAEKLWTLSGPVAPIIGTIVGVAAYRITVMFAMLDQRNADLVEWDEELLKRAEQELRDRNLAFEELEITKKSDDPPPKTRESAPDVAGNYLKYHYRFVVAGILRVFKIIFALAIVGSWGYWFYARTTRPEKSHIIVTDKSGNKLIDVLRDSGK